MQTTKKDTSIAWDVSDEAKVDEVDLCCTKTFICPFRS